MSILAQAPVNEETNKRVLFCDHVEGRIPLHEAVGFARHIAERFHENSNPAAPGPTLLA